MFCYSDISPYFTNLIKIHKKLSSSAEFYRNRADDHAQKLRRSKRFGKINDFRSRT